MILPPPFSTIVIGFGKPTIVPKGLERDSYEGFRVEIENNLIVALAQAESKVRELKRTPYEIAVKPIPTQTSSS